MIIIFRFLKNRAARNKLNHALADILDSTHLEFYDCNHLALLVESEMDKLRIPHDRIAIVSMPEGRDIGHVKLREQYRHEVVVAFGVVYDLNFPFPLPLKKYFTEAYVSEKNIKTVYLPQKMNTA